jgi:hypothetical protein
MAGGLHRRYERKPEHFLAFVASPQPHLPPQVLLIEGHVYDLNGEHTSSIAVLAVGGLSAAQAGPERLLRLNRGQWASRTAITTYVA